MNPSQGTLVVYTGTAGGVNESSVRQTPSDTHARKDVETTLSVHKVSAHTNTALFEEQMAKLKAELARMAEENEKLKGGQLVTLEKKAEEQPSSSYRDELKEEIHELSTTMNSNHELYMAMFDAMEQTLAQVLNLLQTSKSIAQNSGEDPSTMRENRDKGGDDKGNNSNQSNKGNTNTNTSDSAPGKSSEKSKGKEPMHQHDNVFNSDNYDAYPKDMDDDDVFDATYCQAQEEGSFDESYLFQTEEEVVDLEHEEMVRKFKMENEARK